MSAGASRTPGSGVSWRLWLLGAIVGLGGLSAGYVVSRLASAPAPYTPETPGLLWPNPKRLGPFELEATDGGTVDLTRLQGRWSFLFFGFTFCPDVCPATLMTMATVMKQIQASDPANDVQTLFVSVDPQRDTTERMRSYVEFFDPRFVGARAPLERLEALTRQLGILHFRGEPDESGNYEVDHSASILLVDPQARLVGIFGTPHVPETIASQYHAIRTFVEERQ